MRNKLLAMLLALCMVMTMLPAVVFATGNEEKCSCGCPYGTSSCCKPETTGSDGNVQSAVCGCGPNDPKCSNASCDSCKDKTDVVSPTVPEACDCGCAFTCGNCSYDADTNKITCGCTTEKTCSDSNCKIKHKEDPEEPDEFETKCECGCTLAACSACSYDKDAKKIVCGCGGKDKCTCGKENLDIPDGHCACEDPTCTAGFHRGGTLGEYGGSVCVNIPEGDGSMCDACRAYADSKNGTAADPEPETPTQPTTPTAPARDPDAPQKAEDFSDVPAGQWYNNDLTTMLEKGWFVGQAGGTFAPQNPTTGAEVVVILSRVLGYDLVTTGSAWAAEATSWAADHGLSEGISITTTGSLARQDLILMLWRAASKPESSYALSFTDIGGVSGDALTALQWAVEKGIVKGNGDGTVSPNGATKRCEMAALMVRYDAAVDV